jgi:hypothetical protein
MRRRRVRTLRGPSADLKADHLLADRDSRATASRASQFDALAKTSTLYVGNLSFYTTEEQMYELFGRVAHRAAASGASSWASTAWPRRRVGSRLLSECAGERHGQSGV